MVPEPGSFHYGYMNNAICPVGNSLIILINTDQYHHSEFIDNTTWLRLSRCLTLQMHALKKTSSFGYNLLLNQTIHQIQAFLHKSYDYIIWDQIIGLIKNLFFQLCVWDKQNKEKRKVPLGKKAQHNKTIHAISSFFVLCRRGSLKTMTDWPISRSKTLC